MTISAWLSISRAAGVDRSFEVTDAVATRSLTAVAPLSSRDITNRVVMASGPGCPRG
jgi:hypothetical protein